MSSLRKLARCQQGSFLKTGLKKTLFKRKLAWDMTNTRSLQEIILIKASVIVSQELGEHIHWTQPSSLRSVFATSKNLLKHFLCSSGRSKMCGAGQLSCVHIVSDESIEHLQLFPVDEAGFL